VAAAPRAYLDECVDHALVEALQARGFSVTAAIDEGLTGLDDEHQLAHATAEDRLLLTHNEKHFRQLHYAVLAAGQAQGGIALLTQRPPLELLTGRAAVLLDWIGTLGRQHSRLFKWGHLQQLLEEGYRLPGYTEAEIRLILGRPSTDVVHERSSGHEGYSQG
jgi:hypothetical protein